MTDIYKTLFFILKHKCKGSKNTDLEFLIFLKHTFSYKTIHVKHTKTDKKDTYLAGLLRIYIRNIQRPLNARSCSSTVTWGPGL